MGFPDIVVSVPGQFQGLLHLFKGTSLTPGAQFDLTALPADTTILERSAWGPFWWVTAGDVNGDGLDDILGGATAADSPQAGAGTGVVAVIFGSADLPAIMNLGTQDPDVIIYGPTPSNPAIDFFANFGQDILVDDVNGDGVADIVASNGQGVFVVYGGAQLTSGTVIELAKPGPALGPGHPNTMRGVLQEPIVATPLEAQVTELAPPGYRRRRGDVMSNHCLRPRHLLGLARDAQVPSD